MHGSETEEGFRIKSFIFSVFPLTGDQLSRHVRQAAAGLSVGAHGDGVALSTEQAAQLAPGVVGVAGDGVARQGGGRGAVGHGSFRHVPGHQGRLRLAVHQGLDAARLTGNW